MYNEYAFLKLNHELRPRGYDSSKQSTKVLGGAMCYLETTPSTLLLGEPRRPSAQSASQDCDMPDLKVSQLN